MKFDDLDKKKNDTPSQQEKMNNYTSLVKKINPDMLTKEILKRISEKAHIFYICVYTKI